MTAHLSRRSLLRAAPALAVPVTLTAPLPALASAAPAPAETPIMQLYRQWAPLRAAMDANSITDEEMNALNPAAWELEARIDAEPVTSLEDLAAKVLAGATDEDQDGGANVTACVMADCRALLDAPTPPVPARIPMPIRAHPDLSTPEGRISAVCEWFDLEPPTMIPGRDLLADEETLDWMIASGVSLDWLAAGDPKGLAIAFRNDEMQRRASLAAHAA